MTCRGRVRNGVVELPEGVALPDGTEVRVEVIEAGEATGAASDADPLFSLADLAVETGVSDLSANLDHYLYGHPKAQADD